MSNGSKPPITNLSFCQTFQTSYPNSGLYPKPPYLSNLLWTKKPVQNVQKCPINLQKTSKKYKKVWIFLQNPAKKFEGFICTYTREFGNDLRNPRPRMYDSPGSHAGAGINKESS
jgi:hypothetical protein